MILASIHGDENAGNSSYVFNRKNRSKWRAFVMEFQREKIQRGKLGEILIRCNNVMYIRAAPEEGRGAAEMND